MTKPTFPIPKQPILAAALDMDGLLASSEDVYERVGSVTLERRGRTFEDELRHRMMGLPTPKALQLMIDHHQLDDTVEQLTKEGESIFWELAETMLTSMPGVGEFFDSLDQKKLQRGVVTSGTRSYAERILAKIGAIDRIAFLITADEVKIGKPDPEPYLMAAERFGVSPERMIVLEDSSIGCRAGIASGAYAIAVPSPHTVGHDFTGAKFVANTLRDPRIRELIEIHC